MDRKLIYIFTLIGFFLMWAVFGLAAAVPRGEALVQSVPPELANSSVVPEVTQQGMIPVTGNQQLGWGILLVYGLIGFATLALILSLLNVANKLTALYAQRKERPSDRTYKK